MRVLLTNDDGVRADGLRALLAELQDRPDLDVWVSAPERERSAVGHAITLHKPLHAETVELPGARRPAWAVSGTPADSTKIAILALLPERPDLVVSGINLGPNVGPDVLYSGTVSAALEATMLGVPALAVSLLAGEPPDFRFAARFVADLIARLRRAPLPERPYLLNVNVPGVPEAEVAGVAVTRLGRRYYEDMVVPRRDPRGRTYYWLSGRLPAGGRAGPRGTDTWALAGRMVSITPLRFALTDEGLRRRLATWAGSHWTAPR